MLRPFSAIFFIVSRLLTRAISNLALQAIEKVPDVSLNSARCIVSNPVSSIIHEISFPFFPLLISSFGMTFPIMLLTLILLLPFKRMLCHREP